MLSLYRNRPFRHMFLAQAFSLVGSGLATVALGLLAYKFASDSAGVILGTALAIKMIAYVLFSPVAGAIAANLSRRKYLIFLDVVRAAIVLFFPFVEAVWQIYLLIFLMFTITAGFSPIFQAIIPDIVPDEKTYTKALSLSRLAFNVEAIVSPILAGLLMNFISFHWLFVVTSIGFMASAALVGSSALPPRKMISRPPAFIRRLTSGINIYARTPRLRGLFMLNMAVALVGANIFVNSIVIARQTLNGDEQTYLNLLLSYGIGSIIGAVALPFLLRLVSVRTLCIAAALVLAVVPFSLLAAAGVNVFLVLWALIGVGLSLITTASGLLLRSSAFESDRTAVFAAQFSLSHACWLIGYPLAAWLGVLVGPVAAVVMMAGAAFVFVVSTLLVWPALDPASVFHRHSEYSHDHPHVHDDGHHDLEHEEAAGQEPHSHSHRHSGQSHSHVFVIDEHHPKWPNGDGHPVDKFQAPEKS